MVDPNRTHLSMHEVLEKIGVLKGDSRPYSFNTNKEQEFSTQQSFNSMEGTPLNSHWCETSDDFEGPISSSDSPFTNPSDRPTPAELRFFDDESQQQTKTFFMSSDHLSSSPSSSGTDFDLSPTLPRYHVQHSFPDVPHSPLCSNDTERREDHHSPALSHDCKASFCSDSRGFDQVQHFGGLSFQGHFNGHFSYSHA